MLADSVGLALLVVLETLDPAERLAFVLHDTFAVPFDEIAPIVGRTPATDELDLDRRLQREVVDAFLAAAHGGDFDALLQVLDPDVVLRSDGGGAAPTRIVRGARNVAGGAVTYSAHAALFDANCPAFFAANERAEYVKFLSTAAGSYELCLIDQQVAGAYGLAPHSSGGLALRWIVLSPHVHGHGLGTRIMTRVLETAPFFAKFGAQELATIVNGWGPAMHRVDMLLVP